MKEIIRIVETVGNWGEEVVYTQEQDILDYLQSPDSLDTDDAVFVYVENGTENFCLLDDIMGTEVAVGQQKIYIGDT
jgi:hypothetical protein